MNEKKIGIVTIVSTNYGNRLQNYALQTVLQNMGYFVETIRRKNTTLSLILKNYLHYIWKTNTTTQFFKFNKKIKWSRGYWDDSFDLSVLSKQYDCFVAGSDQIWNPYYDFTGTDLDFLSFVDDEKKIAYAASFGVTVLPDEKKEIYREKLQGFSRISVRETAGRHIVYSLTKKRVPVVLDPVLLLTADEWRKLARKPRNMPKGNYTLVYAVEEMGSELKAAVEKEQEKNRVIEVRKLNGREWAIGPLEFLYLIDHADKLLTDSFHGTAFSILFHTPFCIYNRDGHNMNSRMETLLSSLLLYEIKDFDDEIFKRSDMILADRRTQSREFLNNALGGYAFGND